MNFCLLILRKIKDYLKIERDSGENKIFNTLFINKILKNIDL
jgi:hypothetical protein